MVSATFFFLMFLGLVHSPEEVGDELDEAANERLRQYAEELQERMMQLLLEIEEREKEQSWAHMGALLLSALQNWQFWACVGVTLLSFWLLFLLHKKLEEPDSSDEESSSNDENEEGQPPAPDDALDADSYIARSIQWRQLNLTTNCQSVKDLVHGYIHVFEWILTDTFFPVLHQPIGVGSTFEGWTPREDDAVYCFLVPMTAPRGHSFHLEWNSRWELPSRNSRIRVKLECTCTGEQDFGNMLCFLHQPEEELRRNQEPSLLQTLCTASYLDVRKTSYWFQQLVKSTWKTLPESAAWQINVLPSIRSCRLHLIDDTESTLFVEIMFGVQQDNSDIFLSSENTETIFTPDTIWPQSCAVAEMKFFQHIAANAHQDSYHLRCMQLCARILVGNDFTTYMLKTVVMHLLITIPLEKWHRRYFLQRMDDIMQYLQSCLRKKHLDHFFLGNEGMPGEIILPLDFQTSTPPNLFRHLAKSGITYSQAVCEFRELQDRLTRMLTFGH